MINFALVKANHALWTMKLSAFLNNSAASLPETSLTSHQQCKLGQWLYKTGLSEYGHFSEIHALEKVHCHLHESARHIIELKQANHLSEAQRELVQMQQISHEIMTLLDRLERKLPNC